MGGIGAHSEFHRLHVISQTFGFYKYFDNVPGFFALHNLPTVNLISDQAFYPTFLLYWENMDFDELTSRLHEDDPRVRVEALRMLAMLEETRALDAILVMYKNDPDERVRHVAKWAGNIIWQAKERGHDTKAAIEAHFARRKRKDLEEMVVQRVTTDAALDYDLRFSADAARIQRDHVDIIKGESPFGDDDDQTAVLDPDAFDS
jgi:hypothetical protein